MNLEKEAVRGIYLQYAKELWESAKVCYPDFLSVVSEKRKRKNEAYLKTMTKKIKKQSQDRKKAAALVKKALYEEQVLGIHEVMERATLEAFEGEMKRFLKWVRAFSPDMKQEGIGQALRNYVVYAMFNELNGCMQSCTPAIFGYSMLYPYTDNFIDDQQRTAASKTAYNEMIADTIKGKSVSFVDAYHRKTCDLLAAIESCYPRRQEENIYQLLLFMLEAQEASMTQQKEANLSYEACLDISLYKGGISVLIDRYFVEKEMTEEDTRFYLAFGFFLQLADDLQDMTEDEKQGSRTLLTGGREDTEKTVNRLFWFLHTLFAEYESVNAGFQAFILENCYQLILMSVLMSREHFTEAYLNKLEAYFPVSFAFAEQIKENFAGAGVGERIDIIGTLDEILALD